MELMYLPFCGLFRVNARLVPPPPDSLDRSFPYTSPGLGQPWCLRSHCFIQDRSGPVANLHRHHPGTRLFSYNVISLLQEAEPRGLWICPSRMLRLEQMLSRAGHPKPWSHFPLLNIFPLSFIYQSVFYSRNHPRNFLEAIGFSGSWCHFPHLSLGHNLIRQKENLVYWGMKNMLFSDCTAVSEWSPVAELKSLGTVAPHRPRQPGVWEGGY